MSNTFEQIFHLRRAIARLGQADWFGWWDCHALTPTGDYVVQRLFRRTPEVSAAHVAFMAARAEHDRRLPKERLIHLFDLGEEQEGAFERWLIARKADGWSPGEPVVGPAEPTRGDVTAALKAVGVEAPHGGASEGSTVLVDTVTAGAMKDPAGLLDLAEALSGSYQHSGPNRFVPPYIRVRS